MFGVVSYHRDSHVLNYGGLDPLRDIPPFYLVSWGRVEEDQGCSPF